MIAARKIAERRAARAARQLLYHKKLLEWISHKMAENEATLEGYLISTKEDRVALPGGYVVERASESQENIVEVSEPISDPEYEQLKLLETFERWEMS